MYKRQTLGGTGKGEGKRHPTVGNDVLLGAGVKVLGPIEIGDGSRIGAGSVVLRPVPALSLIHIYSLCYTSCACRYNL